jgi:hypothetical protein
MPSDVGVRDPRFRTRKPNNAVQRFAPLRVRYRLVWLAFHRAISFTLSGLSAVVLIEHLRDMHSQGECLSREARARNVLKVRRCERSNLWHYQEADLLRCLGGVFPSSDATARAELGLLACEQTTCVVETTAEC